MPKSPRRRAAAVGLILHKQELPTTSALSSARLLCGSLRTPYALAAISFAEEVLASSKLTTAK